jgi:hypothetical protein
MTGKIQVTGKEKFAVEDGGKFWGEDGRWWRKKRIGKMR